VGSVGELRLDDATGNNPPGEEVSKYWGKVDRKDSKIVLWFAVLVVVLFLARNMIADSLCLRGLDTLLLMVEGRDEFGYSTVSSAVFFWVAENLV
jgi:hypothetical protein